MKMEAQENAAQQEVVEHEQLPISDDVALISSFSSSPTNHQLMTIVMGSTGDESNNINNKCMDDDDDDDAIMMNHISDDADAALDSILETTVAEVNLALASHDDDATAAAAAAAATTAALDAAVTVVAEAMIDDPHHHDPLMMMQQQQLPLLQPPPLLLMDQQQQQQQQSDGSSSNSNKRSFDALTPDEKQADLVKNLNMNSTAAPSASELSWTMPVAAAVPAGQQQHHRVGRWSLDEKIMFLFGLQKFGKGRWKKISTYVPDRSLVQIKSHAQKVLKRMDSGEDVFGRLEENVSRLHFLVSKIHETNGIAPPVAILQPASPTTTVLQQQEPHETQEGAATEATVADVDDNGDNNNKPRKRRTAKKKAPDGTEHILAASALCQLAGPESEGSSNSSMAEEATEEVAKMDDASKPDLLDMVPAEAALNDDNNNNNEAIEIGEGFAV